jgi:preprotein translocase subunit SecY
MLFKAFRVVVGVALAGLAAWLIGRGLMALWPLLSGTEQAGEWVIGAVLSVLAGLAVLGAYYYALIADSPVRRSLENIFAIPELLRKLAFTLALLCIYRVGFHVPLPGLDQEKIRGWVEQQQQGPFGQAMEYYTMLTGGNFRMTLFGLGIMPYISAAIIFQLLATVVPALEKLQKEGPAGYKKIQEYTRYATVALCLVQAVVWVRIMVSGGSQGAGSVYTEYTGSRMIYLMGVMGLTAGTIFLMWLGEQIDEYGIGNGISLLIMAGIMARMPAAIRMLGRNVTFSLTGGEEQMGPVRILVLILMFVLVVAGAILITQGQRRIPIQQAKQTRGRRVYGGQRQYLPLRVNHGGVMPIIFASSLMLFPTTLFRWLAGAFRNGMTTGLAGAFQFGSYIYQVCYIALIFFFAYFWTTVQFKPTEMSEQLQDYGSFIPGLRPGRRTAEYLERVMERITYCGAAFLALIAVIPQVTAQLLKVPYTISAFLGGTGLLIVVSVALDLVQRIEANLVMRNYGGFLGGSTRIKGAYM